MPTIIDGYNLLYATGILGRHRGPSGLESSRSALLSFLGNMLDAKERSRTTVVFDARFPPPLAPRILRHAGVTVRFAVGYETADELIIEMLESSSARRDTVIVSGDHQLHNAARRCGAKAIDSDKWYAAISERHRATRRPAKPERPTVPLLTEDVGYWIRKFGGEAELSQWLEDVAADVARTDVRRTLGSKKKATRGRPSKPIDADDYEVSGAPRERVRNRRPPARPVKKPETEPTKGRRKKKKKPTPPKTSSSKPAVPDKPVPRGERNPFPPGYAEDLLDEWMDDDFDDQ